ncbi:uncharacterized protein LOC108672764 isoform X2 [Hyalella azteca]|nr:uncharacterized protein LOC108672764 isoform X2 [Hyalella azteca]XP_018015983.1 uncharacterized protein LOC108672764 isoform X2 [Hyalella azteca]XP_047735488.1 uncharacterized protein LOC108672764 isoform X2 [Hyalella azteca]XP_047735489.1 uncharacterized protein LOC108672764 isoform X2 [Hyalella azteca]
MLGRLRSSRPLLLVAVVVCIILYMAGHRLSSVSIEPPSFFPWTAASDRNVSAYVSTARQTSLLTPRERCSGDEFLVVVVPSSPGNSQRRKAIRNTYGQWIRQVDSATTTRKLLQLSDGWNTLNNEDEKSTYVARKDYLDHPSPLLTNSKVSAAGDVSQGMTRELFSLDGEHDMKDNSPISAKSASDETKTATTASVHHTRGPLGPRVQHSTFAELNRTLKGKLFFILGRENSESGVSASLMNEQEVYGDIIVEDFVDTYQNLTLKSLFMIKYITNHCPDVKYVAKVDDDVFLHVPNLQRTLITKDTSEKLILGCLFCYVRPILNPTSKWFSPRYMYQGDHYPNYVSGTSYVLSGNVLTPLLAAAIHTPLFHLEDVFITGILARMIGVKPRDSMDFSYQTRPTNPCLYQTASMGHEMEPLQMYKLWNMLHLRGMTSSCKPFTAAETRGYMPSKCDANIIHNESVLLCMYICIIITTSNLCMRYCSEVKLMYAMSLRHQAYLAGWPSG